MENQHVYNQNQLVAEATDAERATFYKHTYGHVAGGVLVFVLIESLMLAALIGLFVLEVNTRSSNPSLGENRVAMSLWYVL